MSNRNSINNSIIIIIVFLYQMVILIHESQKSFVDVQRYHVWYLVLENIRKYFLIILKLCRLNENSSLSRVYYQTS